MQVMRTAPRTHFDEQQSTAAEVDARNIPGVEAAIEGERGIRLQQIEM
jgi:hypothetical protein